MCVAGVDELDGRPLTQDLATGSFAVPPIFMQFTRAGHRGSSWLWLAGNRASIRKELDKSVHDGHQQYPCAGTTYDGFVLCSQSMKLL